MSKVNQKIGELEVNEASVISKQLNEGDYVSIKLSDNNYFKGQIEKVFEENGIDRYLVTNKSLQKSIDITENDKALKTLFYFNKEGNKVNLRFDEREVASLIKILDNLSKSTGRKSEFANLKMADFVSQKTKTQLLQGKRTSIMKNIVWDKEREVEGVKSTKLMPKEGRFQLYYDKLNNYRLAVKFEQKNRELNIPKGRYEREFSKKEKEALLNKGNIGLTGGFINKNTGETFSAYVAVDKELNSVVLRKEESVQIDKVYGTEISKTNQDKLKKGEGIIVNIVLQGKKEPIYVEVNAGAVSVDGIIKMKKESAIKKGLFTEPKQSKKKAETEISM